MLLSSPSYRRMCWACMCICPIRDRELSSASVGRTAIVVILLIPAMPYNYYLASFRGKKGTPKSPGRVRQDLTVQAKSGTLCIYLKGPTTMNQPTRDEFDRLADRVKRIEQKTEEIKVTRVEVASADVVTQLKTLE